MENKESKLEKFKRDLQKGVVDELIIDVIITFNNSDNLKTTSSCSGRISILCFREVERKYCSKRGSFHFIPQKDAFIDVLSRTFNQCKGSVLVRVRGFIVDVETCISDIIRRLLIGLSFKTAVIKPTKNYNKIIIELKSSIALDIPLLGSINIESVYDFVVRYLWRNFIDLNVFRNILWYTISEGFSDDEATLK